jgi:hypothetical protein
MHELPHAFPLSQRLQHCSAGMHEGASDCSLSSLSASASGVGSTAPTASTPRTRITPRRTAPVALIPENFSVRIEGDGVSHETVRAQLEALSPPELWSSADTRSKLRSLVPEYRLSKFQRVLPDRWQSEMIGAYLLDFDGTARLLAGS